MIPVSVVLRPLSLFISTVFCTILSFLRLSWGCSPDLKIDIEQGSGAANVPRTPDQSNSGETIKDIPGAGTSRPPPTTTTARCTLARTLKRYVTCFVPKARHPSSTGGQSDPSTLTDEKVSEPSLTSPDATGTTINVHDGEIVPGGPDREPLTEAEKKVVLAVELPAEEAIPTPNQALIEGKKDDDHCYVLDARGTEESKEGSKEDGCGADISGEYQGFGSYDFDDTYQDDFEFPEHRELKLAIEHLLLHRVPNTISEATEEGGGNEEEVEEASGPSQVQGTQVSRPLPPLPIIVVQAPTADEALRRAREATDDLAALLESMEAADSCERSHLSSGNASSSSSPLVLDPDWLNGVLENYYRTQFRGFTRFQVNNDLVPNDPFADLHNASSRPFF